ncbi:MAG: hypothetical protein EPN60_12165 [Nevskiaceae bacterium]|nr:MAG: hypothetical protein EPN60_12165 [Nevskiaceae bacterium]
MPAALRLLALSALLSLAACGSNDDSTPPATEPPPVAKACAPYEGEPLASLRPYEGLMHMHSSYSDGVITDVPGDYFAKAKSLGYSFVGSSEHSDTLNTGLFLSVGDQCFASLEGLLTCLTPTADELVKWQNTAEQAQAASDENFLAIRGFEWTSDRFGHINVYFSKNFSNAKFDGGYLFTMDTFWGWFTRDADTPALNGGSLSGEVAMGGGSDALAHFNHPHDKCFDTESAECDWNDFTLIPEAVERMFGIELYNTDHRNDRYLPYYAKALDKGWRLAPIGSEDNHWGTYGAEEHPKTVTLATDLGEAAIKAAWLARRTYALAPGQHLRVDFQAEGHPMGSQLSCDLGSRVVLQTQVRQKDGSPYNGTLRLFGAGGQELASTDSGHGRLEVPVTEGTHWYFVRVDGADGLSAAYLAPIWISAR